MQPKYKRVLIKISGEALAGKPAVPGAEAHGIDFDIAREVCLNIKKCLDMGVEVALVVGAGNFWRGKKGAHMDQTRADHMGMLATMMNAIALQEVFRQLGVESRVLSAISMQQFAEPYIRDRAISHLKEGKLVIFGCGTGNPFFTTDTAAALRAIEIDADIALLAKNIDGVYTKDPKKYDDAVKLDRITYSDILTQKLGVIDFTATSLCMDNEMPVLLFNLGNGENIVKAVQGEPVGTVIGK